MQLIQTPQRSVAGINLKDKLVKPSMISFHFVASLFLSAFVFAQNMQIVLRSLNRGFELLLIGCN